MKKPLTILLLIIFIGFLSILAWFLFLKSPEAPVVETLKNFLPFGSGKDFPDAPVTGSSSEDGSESELGEVAEQREDLFRLVETPVAGFIILDKGTYAVVRYADRATGHIYDTNLETLETKKVTNQTLPKIYEAYFRADGNAVLFRSLKDDSSVVENTSLTLTAPKVAATSSPDGALYTIASTPIRGEIGSVAVGSGDTLVYVLEDSRAIVSSNFAGGNRKTIYSSAFTDWNLISAGNSLVIETKASTLAPGYAYMLSTSGNLAKLFGPLNGLTVLPSRNAERALFAYYGEDGWSFGVQNLKTGGAAKIFSSTFAEKCVWSNKNTALVFCAVPANDIGDNEPDNWYRGETSFQDRFWSFNTDTEIAEVLTEPMIEASLGLDVIRPALSPAEDYLVFTNKNDLSLWAFRLEVPDE